MSETKEADEDVIDSGEANFIKLMGALVTYFVVSGTICTFIYLRWIGLAGAISSVLEPLGPAAIGILGAVALFCNYIVMGMLLVNAQGITELLQEKGAL